MNILSYLTPQCFGKLSRCLHQTPHRQQVLIALHIKVRDRAVLVGVVLKFIREICNAQVFGEGVFGAVSASEELDPVLAVFLHEGLEFECAFES